MHLVNVEQLYKETLFGYNIYTPASCPTCLHEETVRKQIHLPTEEKRDASGGTEVTVVVLLKV